MCAVWSAFIMLNMCSYSTKRVSQLLGLMRHTHKFSDYKEQKQVRTSANASV